MDQYVGLLVAVARRRIKQLALSRASPHGLSAPQFWVLVAIAEHPGASQAELCAQLHHDAPSASRLVAALAERGLVRTAADPTDRRRTRLVLTATGERVASELAASAREIREAVTEGMTEAEVDRLRSGLRHVIANLERRVAPTGARGDGDGAAGQRAARSGPAGQDIVMRRPGRTGSARGTGRSGSCG